MRFLTAVHNNVKIHFQNTFKVNFGSQRKKERKKEEKKNPLEILCTHISTRLRMYVG